MKSISQSTTKKLIKEPPMKLRINPFNFIKSEVAFFKLDIKLLIDKIYNKHCS